jgi:hypothetical protein
MGSGRSIDPDAARPAILEAEARKSTDAGSTELGQSEGIARAGRGWPRLCYRLPRVGPSTSSLVPDRYGPAIGIICGRKPDWCCIATDA